ncbi:unnamed protein product [Rhizophagus irregularis]|uniref:Uncharacterized protein n=2 Tax=Rhizophagus irregularis TaxID=588596 RepID=A0A015KGD2_RHIIW|nr:hypothetical protein RirG_195980 [Rhizophagus irregularis DAOM 197198w]CAB4489877.1 unnamed protein product [Rhizophagus irregularis]
MGTSGLTIVRERKAKRGNKTSALGGPSESQYFYEYYFKDNLKNNPASYLNTGSLGAKLIKEFMASIPIARIIPIVSLKELFTMAPNYTNIITTTLDSKFDNSIMLSVLYYDKIILTAKPEKFLGKYEYYYRQIDNLDKKSLTEIDYGDEVVNEGYFSEDQLFNKFLNDIPLTIMINGKTITGSKSSLS